MRPNALVLSVLIVAGAGCAGPERRPDPDGAGARRISKRDVGEAIFTGTRYYQATGGSPVFQVAPDLFGGEVARIDGEVTIEAIDRAGEDEAITAVDGEKPGDKASVKGWFRGPDNVRYEFSLDRVVPASSVDPERTHFGGVGTDIAIDGDSGVGIAAEPKRKAGVAIWGIGAVTREGRLLGEFPFRATVASRTRSSESGKSLGDRDATAREVDQIDLLILTSQGAQASAPPAPQIEERTVPAGQPKGVDLSQIPGFHIVWGHAHVKFRPF